MCEGGAAPIHARHRLVTLLARIDAISVTPYLGSEVARVRALFQLLARRSAERSHHQYCPVDQWFEEDYGLSSEEQLRVGFVLRWLPQQSTGVEAAFRQGGWIHRDLVDAMKHGFSLEGKALDAVSADRSWYAGQLPPTTPESIGAFDFRAFLERPFVRTRDGDLLLTAPHCIDTWLSHGFHRRLLASARKRGQRRRYASYFGHLIEDYCLDLVKGVYQRRQGALVLGEQSYGAGGGKRTSDIALSLGADLLLFEVISSSPHDETLFASNAGDAFLRDLRRIVLRKAQQLDNCAAALLDGEAVLPTVEIRELRSIYPLLVIGGHLPQGKAMFSMLAEDGGRDLLSQSLMRPVTILAVDELERLLACVESGEDIRALLDAKVGSGFRYEPMSRWLDRRAGRPPRRLLSAVAKNYEDVMALLETRGVPTPR